MSVKIRLMRIGGKGRPFYRVVAVDERRKRTGGYLELLGTYNPLTKPREVLLKQDRIDAWVKNGAVMSEGFLRIIGKAPQHVIRPAKKAKAEAKPEAVVSEQPAAESQPEEQSEAVETTEVQEEPAVAAETPAEEVVAEETTETPEVEPTPEPEPEPETK